MDEQKDARTHARTDRRTDGRTRATLNALPHSTNSGGIIRSHNMTMFYPKPLYNEVYYKGTALYIPYNCNSSSIPWISLTLLYSMNWQRKNSSEILLPAHGIHCKVFLQSVLSQHMKWVSIRENLSYGVCKEHRRRPACASVQSDQCLCYWLFGKYHI